ncbi:MAG: hypothetical protein ACI4I1_04475 [Oscillospiraceae bacterium]
MSALQTDIDSTHIKTALAFVFIGKRKRFFSLECGEWSCFEFEKLKVESGIFVSALQTDIDSTKIKENDLR